MYRAIPRPNRLCSEKKVKQELSLHQKKIKEMKAFIDIIEPESYGFLNDKKKKEQIQEIRFTEIDRENKMLLQKISSIMSKTPQIGTSICLKTNHSKFWESSYKKTLNKNFRKKELVKITVENQALLQRIQDKKATLNFKMLEKERREKEKLLGNISEYPLQIYKNHYTNNKMPLETSSRNNFVFSSKSLERNSRNSQIDEINIRPNSKIEPLEPKYQKKKSVLFKNSKKIGNNYFLIEVFLENNFLKIMADDVQMPQAKILEIPEKEALLLLKKFKNDIENFVDTIKMDGDQIYLEGTNFVFKEKTTKNDKLKTNDLKYKTNDLTNDFTEFPKEIFLDSNRNMKNDEINEKNKSIQNNEMNKSIQTNEINENSKSFQKNENNENINNNGNISNNGSINNNGNINNNDNIETNFNNIEQ